MTRFRGATLFCIFLVFVNGPASATSAKPGAETASLARLDAQAAGFSSYLLPNGFKIILAAYPSASSARIELVVKTGSKLEGYGETGMAHLLEHMLFKSAGKRADLKSDLTALGAKWNGTTSDDRTNYFETVSADPDKIDEAIRIEADRFIRASFTKEHLASEMTVVRNELERNDNDPGSLVMRALQRQSFFWHGYSRPTIGARSDIEDAPFSALQAFHQKHYRPDNAALIVSGNFDPQRVLALASKLFAEARNPSTPRITSWTRDEAQAITNRSELVLSAGKTMAASAWKIPGANDRQTYALDLASTAICANDWGSLRKDLVLERKLAVSASCSTHLQPDYSLVVAFGTAGKDADAEVLSRALREHIEAAVAKGVTQEQLDRARQEELNAFARIENDHELFSTFLSSGEVAGDWRLFFWQRDIIKSVTLEEANVALQKFIVSTNRSDVLLRHADGIVPTQIAKPVETRTLVSGKDWPAITKSADPIPSTAGELAKATVSIKLDGSRARAALIQRRTQGDLAWIVVENDYGNEATLSGRKIACDIASQLMAYGGAGLSRDQLNAKMEALQAKWSVSLGKLSVEAPRKNVDAALSILLSAWAAPSLPESEFDRIKAGQIAGYEAGLKDPGTVAANRVSLRFNNYPVQHPLRPLSLEQSIDEIRSVSYGDVKACVSDFSGIAHARLAMVGTFSPVDVQEVWTKVSKLPVATIFYERVKDIALPATVDTAPITVSMPEKPNAEIAGAAMLSISDGSPDFPALRLAVKILGGDADSRIWQRLREREGLAYGAGVSLSGSHFEPRSSLMIRASAASSKADAALSSLKDELERALRDGFSDEEVTRAKRTWEQERKTSLRSEKTFASNLAQGLYHGRDYAWLAQYDAKIAQLTAKEVTNALRKYLADAPIVWMIGRGNL